MLFDEFVGVEKNPAKYDEQGIEFAQGNQGNHDLALREHYQALQIRESHFGYRSNTNPRTIYYMLCDRYKPYFQTDTLRAFSASITAETSLQIPSKIGLRRDEIDSVWKSLYGKLVSDINQTKTATLSTSRNPKARSDGERLITIRSIQGERKAIERVQQQLDSLVKQNQRLLEQQRQQEQALEEVFDQSVELIDHRQIAEKQ